MGMPGMGMGMPGMGGFSGMGMGPMGMMGMNPMAGMMGINPMMMNMMGGGMPFGAPPKPNHDMSKPPKERYAEEIAMLSMMGINDQDAICKALEEANGDLDEAMEKLAG
jgi:NACalpha-BTF3-like transcription factor